jgi:DNA-binding NarL/FixJ family response regulator
MVRVSTALRILVVDDFPLVREGLAAALNDSDGIQVVGTAADGLDALRMARNLMPDVVLLDLSMPEYGGMMLLERLQLELPSVRVLMMTASENPRDLVDAIAGGASGYLTKRATQAELVDAVRTVAEGGSVITAALAGHLLHEHDVESGRDPAAPALTGREREALRLVAQGLTDKEIAARMYISVRTVQNHLSAIRDKTGMHRRAALTRWAIENTLA